MKEKCYWLNTLLIKFVCICILPDEFFRDFKCNISVKLLFEETYLSFVVRSVFGAIKLSFVFHLTGIDFICLMIFIHVSDRFYLIILIRYFHRIPDVSLFYSVFRDTFRDIYSISFLFSSHSHFYLFLVLSVFYHCNIFHFPYFFPSYYVFSSFFITFFQSFKSVIILNHFIFYLFVI